MPNFSHVYVEAAAAEYDFTRAILKRFPKAQVVPIDNYKEVLNRRRQSFRIQKQSMKLILAVEKGKLIYDGSAQVQDFGYDNLHYNGLILNCVYDCDYCYLQGMFPGGNLVVFVNIDDFFAETERAIQRRKNKDQPLYLCISYDTDLLGFESVVPYSREWIRFASKQADLLVEIRTKSTNYKAIRKETPSQNVILAWTISPDYIANRYEKGAPSLRRRLEAARQALDDGWPIRLCFDPVLRVAGWEALWRDCIEQTFEVLPASGIRDVSVGVFRMNRTYFQRILRQREDSDILYDQFELEDNLVTYPKQEREYMVRQIRDQLAGYIPEESIGVWM